MKPTLLLRARPTLSTTLLVSALLSACAKEQIVSEPVRPVMTQKISLAASTDADVYSGDVRPRHEADLGFRIGGKIISRQVDVGARVKKGALLARLDPRDAQLTAQSAQSQVAATETEFNFAKAELERNRDLLAKNFISQAVYDAKLNSFNSAQAKLAQARSQAAVSSNQSAYASLYADQDGVITAVNAEPGQVVAAGQSVVKLARPEEKDVVINIPESRVADIKKVQEVALRLWALPEKIYQGKVREVSPSADPVTRTYTAKIGIVDAADIQLGMTANVLLQQNGAARTAVLPLSALYQQDGKSALWIVDAQGKVQLRPVQTGAYREDGVVIIAGVKEGEVVVTAGVHKLVPGQSVRLPDAAPQAASVKKS
jgi:membrane fusion protein, multidrug efflux system